MTQLTAFLALVAVLFAVLGAGSYVIQRGCEKCVLVLFVLAVVLFLLWRAAL